MFGKDVSHVLSVSTLSGELAPGIVFGLFDEAVGGGRPPWQRKAVPSSIPLFSLVPIEQCTSRNKYKAKE